VLQKFQKATEIQTTDNCRVNIKTAAVAAATEVAAGRNFYHFLPEESDKLGCHAGVIQLTLQQGLGEDIDFSHCGPYLIV